MTDEKTYKDIFRHDGTSDNGSAVFKDVTTILGTQTVVLLPRSDWYDLGFPEYIAVEIRPTAPRKTSAELEVEYLESLEAAEAEGFDTGANQE